MNYYLVSYYARLPKGGFGFGRKYVAVNGSFDLDVFEGEISDESRLSTNDISVISRTPVSVEEYILNTDKDRKVVDQLNLPIEAETTPVVEG